MDHPVKEIKGVITKLCQGSPAEQEEVVNTYFTTNAEFAHPFCWVPPFGNYKIPLFNPINSRLLILMVYRWYRILSPHIEVEIESASYDQKANLLYVSLNQTFKLWFVPFYAAHVSLVTVLRLEERAIDASGKVLDGPFDKDTIGTRQRLFIASQNDLYQVNEFLKFLLPGLGGVLWAAWQLVSTMLSVAGALVLAPVTFFMQSLYNDKKNRDAQAKHI